MRGREHGRRRGLLGGAHPPVEGQAEAELPLRPPVAGRHGPHGGERDLEVDGHAAEHVREPELLALPENLAGHAQRRDGGRGRTRGRPNRRGRDTADEQVDDRRASGQEGVTRAEAFVGRAEADLEQRRRAERAGARAPDLEPVARVGDREELVAVVSANSARPRESVASANTLLKLCVESGRSRSARCRTATRTSRLPLSAAWATAPA